MFIGSGATATIETIAVEDGPKAETNSKQDPPNRHSSKSVDSADHSRNEEIDGSHEMTLCSVPPLSVASVELKCISKEYTLPAGKPALSALTSSGGNDEKISVEEPRAVRTPLFISAFTLVSTGSRATPLVIFVSPVTTSYPVEALASESFLTRTFV